MIQIIDKRDCCGCGACASICSKGCISMYKDSEGFLYPKVNSEICVDCGLCESVCPCLNRKCENSIDENYRFYAARSSNEKDLSISASGAIFPLLAKEILRDNGVVFGAKWNDKWEVEHSYCENEEDLYAFQGSKYTQSTIGNSYIEVRRFLRENRKVLFTGTPCQVLGLKNFLGKRYDNLFCVDILCNSVVSPLIWEDYLKYRLGQIGSSKEDIIDIKFRKKGKYPNGAPTTSIFSIKTKDDIIEEQLYTNAFGKAFGKGIICRPSCSKCPCANLLSRSDITIGDFWGATAFYSKLNPNIGLNLLVVKTAEGGALLERIKTSCQIIKEVKKDETINNGGLKWKDRTLPPVRQAFFGEFCKEQTLEGKMKLLNKYSRDTFVCVIRTKFKAILRRILKK